MSSLLFLRRIAIVGGLALVAAACTPNFWIGSTLEFEAASGSDVRIVWNTASDAEYPDPGHQIDHYEVRVDGALVASPTADQTSCRLSGLASGTTYTVEVTAESTSDENSADFAATGVLSGEYTTPAGSDPGGTLSCSAEPDSDGDRLPDWIETNTGVFVDKTDAGTDPLDADTDDDGISDGDEVAGTVNGAVLAFMGANPLRSTIFLEVDWMDDSDECGAHSHRPTAAMVDRVVAAFDQSPVNNPDGTSGIDLIVDYGQGGVFNRGTLVPDSIAPIGSLNGGVNGSEFGAIKDEHFEAIREGYFHYALHVHRYNTSSSSSGQAEVFGDDLIVSLYCAESLTNTSNTMMHELGHNLSLRHGGAVVTNEKPNYNSIMNYRFQFPGVDADAGAGSCDSVGDQLLSYSDGSRIALDEAAVVEAVGVCGSPAIDWNGNSVIDGAPYSMSLNLDGTIEVLTDNNDWNQLAFGAVDDADGAPVGPPSEPELVDEQPVPAEYLN